MHPQERVHHGRREGHQLLRVSGPRSCAAGAGVRVDYISSLEGAQGMLGGDC